MSWLHRLDDPIAVAEGVGIRLFAFGAQLVVGIAGDVEPVTAPALAVVRGGEEAVYDFGEGVGGVVGFEGGDFLWGGREAREVEGGAADEGAAVGWADGLQSAVFEFREDEAVDFVFGPLACFWQWGTGASAMGWKDQKARCSGVNDVGG